MIALTARRFSAVGLRAIGGGLTPEITAGEGCTFSLGADAGPLLGRAKGGRLTPEFAVPIGPGRATDMELFATETDRAAEAAVADAAL
jgi:hypothetical protein